MRYRRVEMMDRCHIAGMKEEGKTQKDIAAVLKFHPSTVSRELNRQGAYKNGVYHYGWAQESADDLLLHRRMPRKLKGRFLRYVIEKLALRWSPDQISKRMKIDLNETVSAETIYRFVKRNKDEGGDLYLLLRRGRRNRKNRFPSLKRIPKRDLLPTIDERDSVVEARSRIGDWERDTMFGDSRKQAILVMLERRTRLIKLKKLRIRKSKSVSDATLDLIRDLPAKSITNDRGVEFLNYEELNRKIPVYFCHPYTSQERGSVENSIGLIRQYFPKKFDIDSLTEKLKEIETN